MQQQTNSNIPSNEINYNSSENHTYRNQLPSSMIYDPASTYMTYKNDSDIGNDTYPSMTMVSDTQFDDNSTSPNRHHYIDGNIHYRNGDGNALASTTCKSSKLSSNRKINDTNDSNSHNDESSCYNNYSQTTKRFQNTTNSSYGINSVNEPKQPKSDKSSKGLRHFSMKVCEKVQRKKVTTYNEVADELVAEFGENEKGPGNEQNIRRRVYDALNVLMAMNIISKDKKEIRWLGLPSNSAQEHQRLRNEGSELFESIKTKLKTIYELIIQQISLQNLISYNKKLEAKNGKTIDQNKCIQLPFLAISTSKNTDVVCRINEKKDKYDITFSSDFELHDDSEILKRLGLSCNLDSADCSIDDLNRSLSLVPPNLSYYVRAMAGRTVNQFQEHILNNRGYLATDNLMEFYNNINKTVFENAVPQFSKKLDESNTNIESLSSLMTTCESNDGTSHIPTMVSDQYNKDNRLSAPSQYVNNNNQNYHSSNIILNNVNITTNNHLKNGSSKLYDDEEEDEEDDDIDDNDPNLLVDNTHNSNNLGILSHSNINSKHSSTSAPSFILTNNFTTKSPNNLSDN